MMRKFPHTNIHQQLEWSNEETNNTMESQVASWTYKLTAVTSHLGRNKDEYLNAICGEARERADIYPHSHSPYL